MPRTEDGSGAPPFTLDDLLRCLDRLREQADAGCGNHGCIVNPPKGMGTNAGCCCYPRDFARALRQLADAVEDGGDWAAVRRVRAGAARQQEVNAAYLMDIVDRIYEALCDGKARVWQDRAQAAAKAAEALGRTCWAINERRGG